MLPSPPTLPPPLLPQLRLTKRRHWLVDNRAGHRINSTAIFPTIFILFIWTSINCIHTALAPLIIPSTSMSAPWSLSQNIIYVFSELSSSEAVYQRNVRDAMPSVQSETCGRTVFTSQSKWLYSINLDNNIQGDLLRFKVYCNLTVYQYLSYPDNSETLFLVVMIQVSQVYLENVTMSPHYIIYQQPTQCHSCYGTFFSMNNMHGREQIVSDIQNS